MLEKINYSNSFLQTLDRDTGWSGINCNPFEGSLMSQRFDQRGLCPRCGGGMKFVIKDVKEKNEEEEFLENVPDFFRSTVQNSPLLKKAFGTYIKNKPKDESEHFGYRESRYYKCLICGFKKYPKPEVDEDEFI